MIILPTRKRMARRRDEIYEHLFSILNHASVHQVEESMRRIHRINFTIRTYFIRENHEAIEVFTDQDPTTAQVAATRETIEARENEV